MASTSGARIFDLPEELLVSIFSFLPVADMARCAATCEQWHHIISGCSHLWKGKSFKSNRSPALCPETRAVVRALPPFREVAIELSHSFKMTISYPQIKLCVYGIEVMKTFPRLRCEILSTRVVIAGDILTYQMMIDFNGLRQLVLSRTWTSIFWEPHDYSADYVIGAALDLCPNLRHLSVCTDMLSAEMLEAVEGLGQLWSLTISCPRLRKLPFLRHCSALVELRIDECMGMPSGELWELRHLRYLQKLSLGEWRFEERDLVATVVTLSSLEWIELHACALVSDLSFLRHCDRLKRVRFTSSYQPDPPVVASLTDQRLHGLRLPTGSDYPIAVVEGVSLTADDLLVALLGLEALGLPNSCLLYLSHLRHCTRLTHICLEFVRECNVPIFLNVRVFLTLTGST